MAVSDLTASTKFYSSLLDSAPTRALKNQVDWILDEPAISLSIFNNPDPTIGDDSLVVFSSQVTT
jgi:hypothetical protein